MIKLHYNEQVGFSDKLAAKHARSNIELYKRNPAVNEFEFGNQTYLGEWQVAVKLGEVKHVVVAFNGTNIPIQSDGQIEEWPLGFLDVLDEQFRVLFEF